MGNLITLLRSWLSHQKPLSPSNSPQSQPLQPQAFQGLPDQRHQKHVYERIKNWQPIMLNGFGRVHIVGESSFQKEIGTIVGGHSKRGESTHVIAGLVSDPDNELADNTVMIFINNSWVGHLNKETALSYQAILKKLESQEMYAICRATISGGFLSQKRSADFRITLHLAPPERALGEYTGIGATRGRHWSDWLNELYVQKRQRPAVESEILLKEIIDACEKEAELIGCEPDYNCYEQLGIILRKQGRVSEEISILQRYISLCQTPSAIISVRIEKAQKRLRDLSAPPGVVAGQMGNALPLTPIPTDSRSSSHPESR